MEGGKEENEKKKRQMRWQKSFLTPLLQRPRVAASINRLLKVTQRKSSAQWLRASGENCKARPK